MRADRGFFDQALLGFLEEPSLPDIIVARMTCTLKKAAASVKERALLDAKYNTASIRFQLHFWSKPRRFVLIRELR